MREEAKRGAVRRIFWGIVLISFFYSCFASVIAPEGTTDTRWDNQFTEYSPDPCCGHDASGTGFWSYSSGGIYPSNDDCYRAVVCPGSSNFCCDSGKVCDITTNRCVSFPEISSCSSYENKPDCVADAASMAVSSVNTGTGNLGYCEGVWLDEWDSGGVHCVNSTGNCSCVWENSKCTADYSIFKVCEDVSVVGTCSFSFLELTNCSAGFRLMNWSGNWAPGVKPADASCEDGQRNLPCPAQLSFISTVGIIIAVVLLVVLYLIMSRKKKVIKKENKRKKSGK